MKNITLLFLCAFKLSAQDFIPVWVDEYLPNQESGCYVSSLVSSGETLYLGRYCPGESEILFGDIFTQSWLECDLPDSLGEVLSIAVVNNLLYAHTESGWIISVNNSCETNVLAKTDGWAKICTYSETLYIFGSGVYVDGILSSQMIHSYNPITEEWSSFLDPDCESVSGLTILSGKIFCTGKKEVTHKIFELVDSVWDIKYIFPENEYFVSWYSDVDRIYISSTTTSFPPYGIFSELKDGDMDSLFSSDGNILDISASECFVTVVGNFTDFGNCDVQNFAMFSRDTKEVIQTDRGLDDNAYTISSNEDFIYAGGAFIYGSDIYSPGIISLPSCYETGVENISKNEINIFPNPATEFLHVENSVGKVVRIFSLSEEIYLMANEIQSEKIFDIVNLPSGTYYILIEGKVFSFIKL